MEYLHGESDESDGVVKSVIQFQGWLVTLSLWRTKLRTRGGISYHLLVRAGGSF